MTQSHPHIQFKHHWSIEREVWRQLDECEHIIATLKNTPILPEVHAGLLNLSLKKGAQATTAIEGNTLTEEDVQAVMDGSDLPASKEYQRIEVKNILDAMNELLREVAGQQRVDYITPELLLRFHEMIGRNLGLHFEAIPGKFADRARYVGRYRAPDHSEVVELVDNLCAWMRREFCFDDDQSFAQAVIQAIVAHVYLEWIHPFTDGNGRTGRLLEFYVLLRAGNPDIASHILSNHYNQTRPEYYRQLDRAGRTGDLTSLLGYAIQGLRDGLATTLAEIQRSQFEIAWRALIHDRFASRPYTKKTVFKRRRSLMLQLPLGTPVTLRDIRILTTDLAAAYSGLSDRTVKRDLNILKEMELVEQVDGQYIANTGILRLQTPRWLGRESAQETA